MHEKYSNVSIGLQVNATNTMSSGSSVDLKSTPIVSEKPLSPLSNNCASDTSFNHNDSLPSGIDQSPNEMLSVKFDQIYEKLTTNFNGKTYDIYYMDLYDEELKYFLEMLDGSRQYVSIFACRHHICIVGKQLSVKRIPEPQYGMLADEAIDSRTVSISFASKTPFIAKYGCKYYLCSDGLWEEYNDLLQRSGYPMGTSIRILRERVIVDDVRHYLDVVKSRTSFVDAIVVIKAVDNGNASWVQQMDECMGGAALVPKRYISSYDRRSLIEVKKSLIYTLNAGEVDEIYAETDYIAPKETVVKVILFFFCLD